MKNFNLLFACICFMLITLSSCYVNFYRTNTKPSIDAAAVSKLKSENKYFIIHFSNGINGLEQAYVNGDSLYGKIVTLIPEHLKYLHPDSASDGNRVKATDKKYALTEVHLYTTAAFKNNDSLFSADLASFNRADIYGFNTSATRANHIFSSIGIAVAAFFVLVGIALSGTPG